MENYTGVLDLGTVLPFLWEETWIVEPLRIKEPFQMFSWTWSIIITSSKSTSSSLLLVSIPWS